MNNLMKSEKKLINVSYENGEQVVSAKELYLGLGLDRSNWSRWQKSNILENEFFKENIDWVGVRHNDEGNATMDFAITLEFAKHIAMMARTEKSHMYRNYFIRCEKALKEVYHISETAIVNNVMSVIEDKLINTIDKRLSVYEENYRPTHANKIDINNYIKNSLGDDREIGEVDLVKQRVLLMLDANAWQDVPYKKLTNNMRLIDESIRAVKSFRSKSQLSLFER
ncbi:antA/AntB antirepressor family protein [Tissierella praeacuta]|uniref:antA/AntB antirepressor family protein n=1 Tax=Tissierella praeacuta TaxID=43131 RepID=UPI0028A930E2|nr:antA/AntB antirepressor family protein [Tissierella praeacuta]